MQSIFKLGHRLIGSFLAMALIVGVTGIFGAVSMSKVKDKTQYMLENIANNEKKMLLMNTLHNECNVSLLLAAFEENDKGRFKKNIEEYRVKRDQFRGLCDIILNGDNKLAVKPVIKGSLLEERTLKTVDSWSKFEVVAEALIAAKQELLSAGGGKSSSANEKLSNIVQNRLTNSYKLSKESVDNLITASGAVNTQLNQELNGIIQMTRFAFIAAILVAVAAAILLGFLTSGYIVNRIQSMVHLLDRGAQGDLSVKVEVDSSDELGKLGVNFNIMVERLGEMVNKINQSTGELKGISYKITDASQQVISAARVQVKGVSETSNGVIEINSSVKKVGQNVDKLSVSASETSSSILEMAASIEEVALNVDTLAQSVDEVSSSINQMTASVKQIGGNVQRLMDASITTACSIAEMDSSIKQVERNALDTVAISDGVRSDAESGKESVEATILGINEIRTASRITYDAIESLYYKAEDIGKILSVIDEVAEQTNLLALNAAIIAAQAGPYGKGFAVVADEIKELAERTSSSTREISQVIKGVQDETRRAVDAIDLAEQSITNGELLSHKSGEALSKIVVGVQKATDRMSDIAKATIEQAKGSQMIRDAMHQVSEMVSQIATSTEEQGHGSDLIMYAVERMKGLTGEVRRSTREQAKVGNFIAVATENITGMINQIKVATDEQARGSEQIVNAVKDIQQSTQINMDATKVLDNAVNSLSRQIGVFQEEVTAFKLK